MLTLLRWWFVFCASCFGAVVAGNLGFYGYLLRADSSYLGFITIALFALSSLWVGQMTYRSRNGDQEFEKHLPICWYLGEAMMGLGMIGTLTGFLMLLGSAFSVQINTADVAAMTALISKMSVGFSTAAVTTLVGLVCSLLFKLQLINIEYLQKKHAENPDEFVDTVPAEEA